MNCAGCDEGTYCELGTDATDCAGDCMGITLDAVNVDCPPSSSDQLVPDTCGASCKHSYIAWWQECKEDGEIHALDAQHGNQLAAFYTKCAATSGH